MKIVITGIAGLLGSNLSEWMINNTNHTIYGIDDLSGGYKENIPDSVTNYEFDLCDHVELKKVFSLIKPDIVYHFAAYAAEGLSPFMRVFNYKNNIISTANIINNCINFNVGRLIFSSSMAVYGNGWNGERPFKEDDRLNPVDPYGIAKMACEFDIINSGEQHGLDWCIIRPHNVYGKNQNIWDKYRNVIGIWMYQYINNQPMTIFGDGSQKRSFSYIEDCLEPLYHAGVNKNASREIINLGGLKFHTIEDANKILKGVLNDGETVYLESRHEVKDAYPSWEKSEKILGFIHKTDLRKGIANMWDWAQKQPNRERHSWNSYEVTKGLYSYWEDD